MSDAKHVEWELRLPIPCGCALKQLVRTEVSELVTPDLIRATGKEATEVMAYWYETRMKRGHDCALVSLDNPCGWKPK